MWHPKSTDEQPLHFFTKVFLKGEIEEVKKSFFREWLQTKEKEEALCLLHAV